MRHHRWQNAPKPLRRELFRELRTLVRLTALVREKRRRGFNRALVRLSARPLDQATQAQHLLAFAAVFDNRAWQRRGRLTPFQDECEGLMLQRDILNNNGRRGVVVRTGEASKQSSRRNEDLAQNVQRDFLIAGGWRLEEGSTGWALAGRSLPFTSDELRAAIRAGRHRSPEQNLILDVFRVFLAYHQPPTEALACALDCGTRTIDRYRNEGVTLLEQIIAGEVERAVDRSNERQLAAILAALAIDPVGEAEKLLADEAAA